jgi:hypothetical protein
MGEAKSVMLNGGGNEVGDLDELGRAWPYNSSEGRFGCIRTGTSVPPLGKRVQCRVTVAWRLLLHSSEPFHGFRITPCRECVVGVRPHRVWNQEPGS